MSRTAIVMVVSGPARGEPLPVKMYLESYDPDANGGRGSVVLTHQLSRARVFADHHEAMACWRRESTVRPLRPDGKPNRPLTAFTCTFEPVTL